MFSGGIKRDQWLDQLQSVAKRSSAYKTMSNVYKKITENTLSESEHSLLNRVLYVSY